MNDKVNLFDLQINNITKAQAINQLCIAAKQPGFKQAAFVNSDCINLCFKDFRYKKLLQGLPWLFADGSGLRYASKIVGDGFVDNVNGTDLLPMLCEKAQQQGLSLYLLGGKPGVAYQTVQHIQARYPGLRIAGCSHGYFDEHHRPKIIHAINQSKTDILLVAMGAPRQEIWLQKNQSSLNVNLAIGVGGLFDFASGNIARAPLWLRAIGFEWLTRLYHEPKRMAQRYLIGNPLFIYRALQQPAASKRNKTEKKTITADAFDYWYDFKLLDHLQLHLTSEQSLLNKISMTAKRAFWRLNCQLCQPVKRLLDIVVSTSALFFLWPIMLATAAAIKLESKGPIMFCQHRLGRFSEPFKIFKFRSMQINAASLQTQLQSQNESEAGVIFKMQSDPRITRVGRFIRKYSIDELPQLFNVLKGDMSLVGPRPPLPTEGALYSAQQRLRLDVAPGITCLWQVKGRSDLDFQQQCELDLQYIDEQCLTADLAILLQTIPAVISAKGAY